MLPCIDDPRVNFPWTIMICVPEGFNVIYKDDIREKQTKNKRMKLTTKTKTKSKEKDPNLD